MGNSTLTVNKKKYNKITAIEFPVVSATEDIIDFCTSVIPQICNPRTYEDIKESVILLLTEKINIIYGQKASIEGIKYAPLKRELPWIINEVSKKLGISSTIIDPDYLDFLNESKEPNPFTFLLCTHILMPNLDLPYIKESMTNMIYNVKTMLSKFNKSQNPQQSLLYLYSSSLGGSGKGTFVKMIIDWCKEKGIKQAAFSVSDLDGSFVDRKYHENAICHDTEFVKTSLKFWPKMNKFIDGDDYTCNIKMEKSYNLKCQAFFIIASNYKPLDENYRRLKHSFIEFSPNGIENLSQEDIEKYYFIKNGDFDIKRYVPFVEKWILSCPTDNIYDFGFSKNRYTKCLDASEMKTLRSIVHTLKIHPEGIGKQDYMAISPVTLEGQISKDFKSQNPFTDDVRTPGAWSIMKVLYQLNSKGIITMVKESSDKRSTAFNLSTLMDDEKMIMDDSIDLNVDCNLHPVIQNRILINRELRRLASLGYDDSFAKEIGYDYKN